MRRLAWVVLLSASAAFAGELHTSVTLIADVQTIVPGATFHAGLLLTMKEGWHTYARDPGDAGIPTSAAWTLPEGFTAGEIQWPVPEKQVEPGNIVTYGYTGEVMLIVPITVARDVRLTPASLTASVEWLECKELCVPGNALVSLTLPVSLTPPLSDHQDLFARYNARALQSAPDPGSRKEGLLDRSFVPQQPPGSSGPLALYFFFALIGGLLLNIMPCVLPVIALKIFGLVRMAGDKPAKVRQLGWFFSLGILASFLLLAAIVVALQAAGQQVGWGFQFQEPLFVIAMAAIVFAFGLSLFGVYEIALPGSAVIGVSSVIARTEGKGGGFGASFSEGVFATILATPCTAPFLGTALGFAFSQPPAIILAIFATVALGMSLPYLLITAKPAWLKFLPKPGAWMNSAKQFMGFLMMATLLWLLYVLGKQLGMEAVIWTGAFLLAIAVAAWLVGSFATLVASRRIFWITWTLAIAVVAGGYWLFLESALNVRQVIAGVPANTSTGSNDAGGITWKPFSTAGLESELAAGNTVFVDFSAEWCLTCKVNERTVLADEKIVAAFKKNNVVAVKADWTSRNPEITKLLSKFGRSGVPLYVVFPKGKPGAPIILPEVITTGIVLEALNR